MVTGTGRDAGAALVDHPHVDKVSFTGSTEVGRGIAGRAGERLAHVSLELGGRNPSIVFPGEVTDELVEGLVSSSRVTRQGQSCTAGSRLYLHRDVHDEVLARLADRLGALKIGSVRTGRRRQARSADSEPDRPLDATEPVGARPPEMQT